MVAAMSAPGGATRSLVVDATHYRVERDRDHRGMPWRDVIQYRNYSKGIQPSTLTNDQRQILKMLVSVTAVRAYADNMCKVALRTTSDRVAIESFTAEPSQDSDAAKRLASDVEAYLGAVMTRNNGGALQASVHYATLRDGNHAIGLNWDNTAQRVRLRQEQWWDGESGVFVAYDDNGDPSYAVKDWTENEVREVDGRMEDVEVERRVIWWPNRIERYRKSRQGWEPSPLPGEPLTGIVPWVRPGTLQPLHIPVVHFAYGSADEGPYGASDLAGGVLALQDEVNDIQRSVTASARLAGFPMYTASGIAEGSHIEVAPGQWITNASPDAKFGSLPAGEIQPLLDAYRLKVQSISRVTSTPIHTITGDWPSGEALIRAEMPLLQKIERYQDDIGGAWATVAHRATELGNAFGRLSLDEDAMLSPDWSPADRRDPLTMAQVDTQRARALSETEMLQTPWALQQMGVDPETIALLREFRDMAMIDGGALPTVHDDDE